MSRYSILLVVTGFLFSSVCIAQDYDGDGVADAFDCSPNDAAIAFPHRYYFDLDGDQSGDLANSVSICSKTPFPGTVLWHGDPDDSDPQSFLAPASRDNRIFGLDFLDSNEANESVIPYIDELGVEALSVNIHWVLYESAPGVFNGADAVKLDIVRDVASFAGIKLNLTFSAMSPYGLVSPTDLAVDFYGGALRFSDQAFIDRYNAALTNLHQRLGSVELVSLQIGHEIDRFIRDVPIPFLWSDFEVFICGRCSPCQVTLGHAVESWRYVHCGRAERPCLGAVHGRDQRFFRYHQFHLRATRF
ncbi:MAG: hypothetical protein GY875_09360 [Gammaproteobacteria bacterium]|nr:hypothetical protein [Gammaproteobacteria bacterium]